MSDFKAVIVAFVLFIAAGAIGWFARQSMIPSPAPAPAPAPTSVVSGVPQTTIADPATVIATPRKRSGYSAEIAFNVVGGGSPLEARRNELLREAEMTSFIKTQTQLFAIPEFLQIALKTDTLRNSRWYKETADRLADLQEGLEVSTVPGTTLFRVTLTIPQQDEVAIILNAIGEQYINWLDTLAAQQREKDMRAFRDQLNTAEKNLNRALADADDFRSLHDMTAIAKTMDIAMGTLQQLESELTRLTMDHNLLQARVDKTTMELSDKDFKLPAEAEQQIERDPTFRSLDDQRLVLERQRDLALREKPTDNPEVKKLVAELEVVKKQRDERYLTLYERTKRERLETLAATLGAVDARILNTKKKHDEKQAEIRRLDNDLVAYKSREDAVKAAREEYNRALAEFNRQDSIVRTSTSRVQFVKRALSTQ